MSDFALHGGPETGLDPLRSIGTSIGLDGTNDHLSASHSAPYAVNTFTLMGYSQPDSTPSSGNRVIISKVPTSGHAHEISVEQRNVGGVPKLAAYISDTTGAAQWIGGPDGVVTIPDGAVFQWAVVVLGGSHAELWYNLVGGVWTLGASIDVANIGLSANDGAWLLGAYQANAFFDGVVDDFRFWANVALTRLQLGLLDPPVTITHDGDEPVGLELTVPSLAEWLKSDEPNPTVTKYVSNQNRGNGSGSSPANAQEVQAALNDASPGETFLAICQTPGVIEFWDYPNGLTFPNGSAGNFITLQARQGDGVVITASEFAAFRTPNSGAWTQSGLAQADIDKKIWRSSATFASGSTIRLYGIWHEFSHPHHLLAYNSLAELQAAYGRADTPTNYGTPGAVLHTDGRVYIRMQKPHSGKYSLNNKWRVDLWPNNPEAISGGKLNYPVSENPNDYPIYLSRRSTSTTAFAPSAGITGGFIKIGSGINSCGHRKVVAGHDIIMRRGTHIPWREFISATSNTNQHHHYDVQRARISCGSKVHAARGEWKFGGWLEGDRGAFIEFTQGTNGEGDVAASDCYFKDCTIADFHELVVGTPEKFRWRNCTIFNILDDGIQGNPASNRCEIGWCFILNSALGGNSGSGTAVTLGQWYVHHNVIDMRGLTCTNWRSDPHPHFGWMNHSASGDQPKRIYNNTLLWGPDVEEEAPNSFTHNDNRDNAATVFHEVFNNIIIRHDTQRYAPTTGYSDVNDEQTDYAQNKVKYGGSNEAWDYNLYYRSVPQNGGAQGGFQNGLYCSKASRTAGEENYATLAAWRSSGGFNTSKSRYSPGFEANSTDTKPTLPSLETFPASRFKYRPSPTGAVTTATTSSLKGTNWWSSPPSWGALYFSWNDGEKTLAPSGWKGALDPSGDTLPVGVQNP